MDFSDYVVKFTKRASVAGYTDNEIAGLVEYASRLNDNGLPIIWDQEHLAALSGCQYEYLLAVSNAQDAHYRKYNIPKKSGGYRLLEEPYPTLKDIQNWILKNILITASKIMVSAVAKAYMPNHNLRDNARFHKNKKTVVALDLKNFFGNVSGLTVFYIFKDMGYNSEVSMMLEKLCTNQNHLPQGAPTSPMLSNMAFKKIDDKIFNYCRKNNILYTRYADDLTFSGDTVNTTRLISYVKMLVSTKGFSVNDEKTKVMGRGMRQTVTGVVVNDKMQVPREYRKKIRQEMYYTIKFGIDVSFTKRKDLPEWIKSPIDYAQHLYGKICHVIQINPYDKEFASYKLWMKENVRGIVQ